MLDRLTRALNGTPTEIRGALLTAFHLAFAVLALPGLLLGGLYALTRPAPFPLSATLGLVAVALLVGLIALRMAAQSARDPRLKPRQAALTAAIGLASAPAIPFLLGCTAFSSGLTWGALWALALAFYGYARTRLAPLLREGTGESGTGTIS